MLRKLTLGFIVIVFVSLIAYAQDGTTPYTWDQLPEGFPQPLVPANNPMTVEKVALGKHLFYDVRLSGNETQSCASCHQQELAFTDALEVSVGSTGEETPRSSMSLVNVAYNSTFTWAHPSLQHIEQQIVIPMFGEFPVEMGITGSERDVLERISSDPIYQELFAAAYPAQENPISFRNITQAIASFTRSIVSGNSPYDQFVYQGNADAMSESALRGLELFHSEQFECFHCHGTFNFTMSTIHANSSVREAPFHNVGLFNLDGEGAYPMGNRGIYEITGDPNDMGRFRAPSLRNVGITAPYMHDGSIATLEDVLFHYQSGGRNIETGEFAGDGRSNPNKSGFVSGFEATEQEIADVIAFLESLTDESVLTDPRFSNPWQDN